MDLDTATHSEIDGLFFVLTHPHGEMYIKNETIPNGELARSLLQAIEAGGKLITLPQDWVLQIFDLRGRGDEEIVSALRDMSDEYRQLEAGGDQ